MWSNIQKLCGRHMWMVFKMSEEFDMNLPMMDKPIKCIMAASGKDTYVMIQR